MSIVELKDRIRALHQDDSKQLEVIFSPSKRLLVEAPAGYGKTKTIVSKIAYMLASKQIPNPKRLLALTFSVNAAYKIKKDVAENIPKILQDVELSFKISDKIHVTNYHGFARRLLKRHGSVISHILREVDELQSFDDSDTQSTMTSVPSVSYENAEILSRFNLAVKRVEGKYIADNIDSYNKLVVEELLPLNMIPYNAILTLAYKLLKEQSNVKDFYHNFYTTVLVDEYQDTNILSFALLGELFNEQSNIILMGDSLQRIYGFIGAVPNLLEKSKEVFKMEKIELDKNYRFQSNRSMLLLDRNIRRNAENPLAPEIEEIADIDFVNLESQKEEAEYLAKKCIELLNTHAGSKVAILAKQRGLNIDLIVEEFRSRDIPFFLGMFTDEDSRYTEFNKLCLAEFNAVIKVQKIISKKVLAGVLGTVRNKVDDTNSLKLSLTLLLEVFLNKILSDFSFLSNEEKISFVRDTLAHNGLKQYVEFVDANIVFSTVHGSKGLEWDFVILPDMEAYSFPNYHSLCGYCDCQGDCVIKVEKRIETRFLEELSVFYVAVTRARKQVFFSASKLQINSKGIDTKRNISCLLKLPGIQIQA